MSCKIVAKAKFRRRTSHEPNRMQRRKILCSLSLAYDSAHVKYGVWTGHKFFPLVVFISFEEKRVWSKKRTLMQNYNLFSKFWTETEISLTSDGQELATDNQLPSKLPISSFRCTVSNYHNRRKPDRTLKNTVFFHTSTTLSAVLNRNVKFIENQWTLNLRF